MAFLCAFPLAAIKAYQAYFIKDVIDGVFEPGADVTVAYKLAGIIFGLAIINYPFRFIHFYGMRMVVDRATCAIRRDIYNKFQNLSSKFYSKAKQGELLSVMINDTAIFSEAFMHGLALIREPLSAILLLGVAFYHDWKLTLIILIVVPFFIGIFTFTGKRIRRYVSKSQEDTADMTHHAAEGLVGQKIIKAFGLNQYMLGRFDKAQNKFLSHKQKSNSAEEHSHPAVELVGALAFALIIILAYFRNKDGGLTAGEFMSFVGSLALFMDPVRRFSKSNTKLNQARAAAARIFKLLDEKEEVNEGKINELTFDSSIEFKNVTFSYGDNPVIKNFNLKIEKGQKVAFVGLSGSGKSTLISLLLRLYNIQEGQILIDGYDIKDIDLKTLRSTFALVSQDIFLFNDTVYENLVCGANFSDEKVTKALEVSYADEFIKNLPEGMNTHIGDRGTKLSGGQSQRLTIARAFLKEAPIMLFDEATSALDNESEKVVQKALDKVGGDKTVIAIAHRLSTIQSYDHIVVLKEGMIVESGTHEVLINNNNEYKKLYDLSNR
ncbi:MAG: ABC transporter ATP-binding protein/permease [Bacteriovoracaceae bacterium]|nr:ABC transporter ATP-binding protein/permease [Bacteriovoracaceae bacterium]